MTRKGSTRNRVDNRFVTIPSSLLAGVFGQVAYRKDGSEVEVVFNLFLHPDEEWQTAVAIDAAEPMRALFGRTLIGDVPLSYQERYHRQNLVYEDQRAGKLMRFYQPEAFEDALNRGFLNWTPNEAEPRALEMLEFLAKQVDADQVSRLLYWGCGNGSELVDLGEFSGEKLSTISITGPEKLEFGKEARLLPLVKFLTAKFAASPRTMVVIVTNGFVADIEDVKGYCSVLSTLISSHERPDIRFAAIGVGKELDEKFFGPEGMNPGQTSGIWDSMRADELEDLQDVFEGFLSDDQIVASQAQILDATGKVVQNFEEGLPARVSFRMAADSTSFSLKTPGRKKPIQQTLLLPFRKDLV